MAENRRMANATLAPPSTSQPCFGFLFCQVLLSFTMNPKGYEDFLAKFMKIFHPFLFLFPHLHRNFEKVLVSKLHLKIF
jgi:hypothetical protein